MGKDLLVKRSPERGACLIANKNLDLFIFVSLAPRLDVNTIYFCLRTKVVLPHCQAPATDDPEFQGLNLLPDEAGEMAMVILKIVSPLPDPFSCRVGFEEGLKRVVFGKFRTGERSVNPLVQRGRQVGTWQPVN